MVQTTVDLGSGPNTGDGDPARVAFQKVNDNANDAETRLSSLEGQGDAKYIGVYADLTALQTAHPTAVDGSTATVTIPNGNIFYYDSGWADSGSGFLGDMLKSVYDPTNKSVDVYDYANATGVTQGTGGILTHTLTGTTDNFNPTNFLTYNYFIFDMTADRDFTGWEAPPAGVERIIRGVNVSDKKIKFKNNDSGSSAGNRLMLRDKADKDCKKGEPFGFRYLHSQSIWVTEIRIG
ncbi:hypothetical protein KAR91_82365 [Candidatus Pacearchaeota archaeon]|nr:hypothetical protein [Candidatus Pacearchaeota archaeon]